MAEQKSHKSSAYHCLPGLCLNNLNLEFKATFLYNESLDYFLSSLQICSLYVITLLLMLFCACCCWCVIKQDRKCMIFKEAVNFRRRRAHSTEATAVLALLLMLPLALLVFAWLFQASLNIIPAHLYVHSPVQNNTMSKIEPRASAVAILLGVLFVPSPLKTFLKLIIDNFGLQKVTWQEQVTSLPID